MALGYINIRPPFTPYSVYLRGTRKVGVLGQGFGFCSHSKSLVCPARASSQSHTGGCQNYGPFFGYPRYWVPYYNRDPKGTIILTTTHTTVTFQARSRQPIPLPQLHRLCSLPTQWLGGSESITPYLILSKMPSCGDARVGLRLSFCLNRPCKFLFGEPIAAITIAMPHPIRSSRNPGT